eukprot:scaffold925_cov129-Cylindrotheca_fusiformis.AAC.4
MEQAFSSLRDACHSAAQLNFPAANNKNAPNASSALLPLRFEQLDTLGTCYVLNEDSQERSEISSVNAGDCHPPKLYASACEDGRRFVYG